jgi:hypothetical protein
MIHGFFLLAGIFMVVWGIVICIMLITVNIRAGKAIWLVTIPGVLVIAVLALNFACHLFHLPHHIIPYQRQVVNVINWTVRFTVIPLLLAKLYELWGKRRARVVLPRGD